MKYLVLSERPESATALAETCYNAIDDILEYLKDEAPVGAGTEWHSDLQYAFELLMFVEQNNYLAGQLAQYELGQVRKNLQLWADDLGFNTEAFQL